MVIPFIMDAGLGINILRAVYGSNQDEAVCYDDLLENPERVNKEFNDRVPTILKKGSFSKKIFTKGWKFDMFNVRGQLSKQIAASAVIFAQLYFSIIGCIVSQH